MEKKTQLVVINEQEVLGKQFRIYGTFERPLFVAKDVAIWIEHSNPTEMLRGIDEDEKLTSVTFSAGQKREILFLTEKGIRQVLANSRKPKAKLILNYISDWKYKILRKETKFGIMLYELLDKIVEFEEQYLIEGYKIDFYFPSLNLAVEYDEQHHKNQNLDDIERENNIKKSLGCEFLRVTEGIELQAINLILRKIIKD